MKFLKTYEFFWYRDEEPEIEEIQVDWTGTYDYKGKKLFLKKGDLTNKGIIINIIEDLHSRYNTNEGSFLPEELIVYKSENEEALKTRIDAEKYNL